MSDARCGAMSGGDGGRWCFVLSAAPTAAAG